MLIIMRFIPIIMHIIPVYNVIQLHNRVNCTNYFYGLYVSYYNTVDTMEGNKVNISTTSYAYGIYSYYSNQYELKAICRFLIMNLY
jgi:hypothetical protein